MVKGLRAAIRAALGAGASGAALLSAVPALAQEAQPALEEVVVVGTRTAGRSLDESLAPVDLVTPEAIRQSSAIPGEVGAAIQSLVPSFNLPRQSNSNFADVVRPAQLRNLSPDQVLVLVNGKRRHTTSTLTTESKLGKGTSPVDFNSIPVGAIKRIEVLRDGAGAQYGSDAIAGVINVVLKDADQGGEATATWGQNRTDFEPTGRSVNDGDTLYASVNSGFGVGGGFLNLTAEYRDRDPTLRSGPDQIPFFENQTPPNLALAGTQTHKAGDGQMEDISFMYNASVPVGDTLELYSFGSYSDRNGEGANFFRYPDSFANVPTIFPDGYIPVLEADNVDLSFAAGLRGTLASDWDWDLSAVYGSNDFDHDVTNSLNVSLGEASPTSFNVGEYKYAQTSVRFDMTRAFDVGGFANPLNLAWGLEYRNESYETEPGDPESYEAGPVIGAPIGTQAGSGLKPEETVDVDRDAAGVYVDVETNLTDRFQAGVAARFEDYSDFGNSVDGKVSGRYELTGALAVRGTVGTGFRAPSLTQAFFRGSTTSFGEGGQLENVLNLPTEDPIAVLLGAQDLDAEESVSYNLGFVFTPDNGFRLTVDFYRVDIDDRITLSERIGGPEVTDYIEDQLGIPGVLGVRFFTNAIDTQTEGFDVVADYAFDVGPGSLTLSAAYNNSDTEVTEVDPNPPELDALGVDNVLFGVEERNTIETASPDDKVILSAHWQTERWSVLARGTRWGEATRVFNFGGGFEPEQTYGAEWGVDLDVEFAVTEKLSVAVGGNNVLDEYPDLSSADINYFGNLPYDVLSPITFNGAFYYLRTTYTF
ncbi:MAG TPA: TonB-dependent receptor [Steroidobacteraceae bacterium]|nr:TonB-dependent receptor [Steroidobacteraceae bacterium]